MKPHIRKHLFTCALLAGAAFAVQAQPAPGTPPAGGAQAQQQHRGHKFDPAKRAEFVQKRLADLKAKLNLQPNQESAWASFANAMQPPANLQRPDRDAIARMSTPDRIDHLRALRSQRNAEMDRRAEAAKTFYAQLGAEQKKTFDDATLRMFGGGHHGRHHRG
jgi:hypothetical protein